MNPCPCGYQGHPSIPCQCAPNQILKYQSRISGPLLDRFDMHVGVPVQDGKALFAAGEGEVDSETVRQRVQRMRERQSERGVLNAHLAGEALHSACSIDEAGEQVLEQAMSRLGLSARALHRVLRVGRTIADLAGAARVEKPHLVEALGYRLQSRAESG